EQAELDVPQRHRPAAQRHGQARHADPEREDARRERPRHPARHGSDGHQDHGGHSRARQQERVHATFAPLGRAVGRLPRPVHMAALCRPLPVFPAARQRRETTAAGTNSAACVSTMVEPLGTSSRNEAASPISVLARPSNTLSTVIWANVRASKRAVAAGMTRYAVIRAMRNTSALAAYTMAAICNSKHASMPARIPSVRANSSSKVAYPSLPHSPSSSVVESTATPAITHRSGPVTPRIDPNSKSITDRPRLASGGMSEKN